MGVILKRKCLLPFEAKSLPLRVDPFLEELNHSGKQIENQKSVFPFKKKQKKTWVPIHLNPIALRKDKVVYKVGLSECKTVKLYLMQVDLNS